MERKRRRERKQDAGYFVSDDDDSPEPKKRKKEPIKNPVNQAYTGPKLYQIDRRPHIPERFNRRVKPKTSDKTKKREIQPLRDKQFQGERLSDSELNRVNSISRKMYPQKRQTRESRARLTERKKLPKSEREILVGEDDYVRALDKERVMRVKTMDYSDHSKPELMAIARDMGQGPVINAMQNIPARTGSVIILRKDGQPDRRYSYKNLLDGKRLVYSRRQSTDLNNRSEMEIKQRDEVINKAVMRPILKRQNKIEGEGYNT
jgi:hypothetical protein